MQGKNLSLMLIIADGNWKASIHVLAFMHTPNCFINLRCINKPMLWGSIKSKHLSAFNFHVGRQIQERWFKSRPWVRQPAFPALAFPGGFRQPPGPQNPGFWSEGGVGRLAPCSRDPLKDTVLRLCPWPPTASLTWLSLSAGAPFPHPDLRAAFPDRFCVLSASELGKDVYIWWS